MQEVRGVGENAKIKKGINRYFSIHGAIPGEEIAAKSRLAEDVQ